MAKPAVVIFLEPGAATYVFTFGAPTKGLEKARHTFAPTASPGLYSRGRAA
jgi:hypothetical protein